MLPERIEIGHFRALRHCTVDLVNHTVLVGPNSAGKSTILHALRFFFEPGDVLASDFQHGTEDEIRVTVTLGALSRVELDLYVNSVDDAGRLIVTRSASAGGDSGYTVVGSKYDGFDALRALRHEKPAVFTPAYRAFVDANPQFGLAKPRSADDSRAELRRWESENPERLTTAEIAFDFHRHSKTQLIESTRLVYVPAVHDAEDAFRPGRTPLGQMIDALVMPSVQNRPELEELRRKWYEDYQTLFPAGGTSDLTDLADRLSRAIGEFVPGTSVKLSWSDFVPDVQLPDIDSLISEDEVPTQIDRQGHGMQRAVIIALLQARDEQLRDVAPQQFDQVVSHVLLLIEEPELYQHPPRARHFRRVLEKLASQPGKNCLFRVVSTTHSPDFVSLKDIASVRIVRKLPNPGGVPLRKVTSVGAAQIIEAYARTSDATALTENSLMKNLHALDGPLREAFFSSAIVLTEGVSDIGILGALAERSVDLEARGVVMASTAGKGQLPLAIVILTLLGIKHFVVFDSDTSEKNAENVRILRAIGVPEAEIPKVVVPATAVTATHASLKPRIEDVARSEFGEVAYDAAVREAAEFFGKSGDVMKNLAAARYVTLALLDMGLRSTTLDAIVERLSGL